MVTAAAPLTPLGARQEWRLHWILVLSAMIGISLGAVPSATLGLFMDPLQKEFGWSRSEISAGLTIFALISLPLTPFAGVLVDRFGARRIAVPGLALCALTFAAFSLQTGSIVLWFSIWVAYTLASLLIRSLVWSTAVSGAFSASRGLAIAILLSGSAIGASASPIISRWLIDSFGWRTAYLGLGLGWGGLAFVLTLLFFRIRRTAPGPAAGAAPVSTMQAQGGLIVSEALRSLRLHRIAIATFLQTTMATAMMVHMVPMLTEQGLSRVEAAGLAAMIGASSVAGTLVTGWLVDRIGGRLLPVAGFVGPVLAYLLFLQASGSAWLLLAAVTLLGFCSGASYHLTTYLTTRYAGLRNFGTIFGFIATLMALAAGIGPLLAGAIFDTTGSYTILILAGIAASLIAGIAVFGLGPYPEFRPPPETADDTP